MRTVQYILSTIGIALLTACTAPPKEDPMAAQQRAMIMADSTAKAAVAAQEATVRALFDMMNGSGTDGIEKLVTDSIVDHQMPTSITTPGMAGLKEEIALYHTAYPDFKQEILGMATQGERTYVHLRMTGTNTGAWGPMPATGKKMDVLGCDVFRFENGKAAEHWGYMEEVKMMQQLGLMPSQSATPEKKK